MASVRKLKEIVDSNLSEIVFSEESRQAVRRRTNGVQRHPWRRMVPALAVAAAVCIMVAVWPMFKSMSGNHSPTASSDDVPPSAAPSSAAAMEGTPSNDATPLDLTKQMQNFSFQLLRETASGKNTVISPVSAHRSLLMVAEGAAGETYQELHDVLGDASPDYLQNITQGSRGVSLHLANGVWYNQDPDLTMNQDFMDRMENLFHAPAVALDLKNPSSAGRINQWVEKETDGRIKELIKPEDLTEVMAQVFLTSALTMDAAWERPYDVKDNQKMGFQSPLGDVTAEYMISEEKILEYEGIRGIRKQYKGGKYSFVALLPREGQTVEQLMEEMDWKVFGALLDSQGGEKIYTALPKFKTEFTADLSGAISAMGAPTAFNGDKADFSRMGSYVNGNLYLDKVRQSAMIEVNEEGTKAAAGTMAEMAVSSCGPIVELDFDRPFLYAVVEGETSVPVFLGVVQQP